MTQFSLPDASIVESISPDGKTALVRHEVLLTAFSVRGSSGGSKKGSKEQEREKAKSAEYDPSMVGARAMTGGWGVWREEKPVKELQTRTEKKDYRDFQRMYDKLLATYEPLQRQDMKDKMIERFGTANYGWFKQLRAKKLQTDTRIQLVTRFGRVVKTTVQECTEHAKAQELRFALGMEGGKK